MLVALSVKRKFLGDGHTIQTGATGAVADEQEHGADNATALYRVLVLQGGAIHAVAAIITMDTPLFSNNYAASVSTPNQA